MSCHLAGVRHTTKALVVLLAALIEVVHRGLGRLVSQAAVVAVTQEGEQRQEVTVGLNIEISISSFFPTSTILTNLLHLRRVRLI